MKNLTTFVTSGQSSDIVTDSQIDIKSSCGWTIHLVSNPATLPAQVLAGVELGAVIRMWNQVVLRIFGNFSTDFIVS